MKISVIIPAFNRASLIGETLKSLLNQTRPADEIIVVDDGSTDDTADVALGFGHPIRLVRQTNRGPGAARNTGFRASSGEIIHFFDSDDLAARNKHEIQMEALNRSGADIALCPWVQGQLVNKRFNATNHVLQQRGLPKESTLIESLLCSWSIVPHAALFRRSTVEGAGPFDETLFTAEDQLFFLNCLLAGARVVHSPGTIQFYRVGSSDKITVDSRFALRRLRDWARFLMKGRCNCLKSGIEPLKWIGFRRRILEAFRDLKLAKCDDEELMACLREIAPSRISALVCDFQREINLCAEAVRQRLTGGRAHSAFRIGPISGEQIALLDDLGYTHIAPRRLKVWPNRWSKIHP